MVNVVGALRHDDPGGAPARAVAPPAPPRPNDPSPVTTGANPSGWSSTRFVRAFHEVVAVTHPYCPSTRRRFGASMSWCLSTESVPWAILSSAEPASASHRSKVTAPRSKAGASLEWSGTRWPGPRLRFSQR